MEKKRILIIGAGQLGSRHLQGVLKYENYLHIYVVDPSETSLQIAKNRANEVEHTHTIHFSTSRDITIQNIDIAIIATNSMVREKVVEELLENVIVNCLILEKVLFPNLSAYDTIADLIKRKEVRTWVNHPRRMYPIYQGIKKQLQFNNQKKIFCSINGNDWGLGCNSLHYIDLFCFLMNSSVKKVDTSWLDPTIHDSKREGYIEFSGTLKVDFNCGSTLILTSFDGEAIPANVIIQSSSFKWVVQEGGKAEVDVYESGQPVKTEKITPLFQSQLSTGLVASLLNKGTCDLPTFEEAQAQHISFIAALLDFYQATSGGKTTHLNIT